MVEKKCPACYHDKAQEVPDAHGVKFCTVGHCTVLDTSYVSDAIFIFLLEAIRQGQCVSSRSIRSHGYQEVVLGTIKSYVVGQDLIRLCAQAVIQ